MSFMADQSSFIFQKQANHRPKELNIATGLSKSGYHDPLVRKNNDSTRILAPEMIDVNQDHKRRCLEKLVVRREPMSSKNCALEVEVIDDTALIEATAAVTRFKNRYRNKSGVGYGNNSGNVDGLKSFKEESDGKKKRNKELKKQGTRCSMKCVNEKKSKAEVVDGKITYEKMIAEGKGHKGCRKMFATVKHVYKKKETKVEVTGVEEHHNVIEKIKETGVEEHQSVVEKIQETDVNLKVLIGDEKESTFESVETETVNEKDDGLELNHSIDVNTHNEAEDENVRTKKCAYSREEMEALRFVDEAGQKSKWTEVYSGFAPFVAKEYNRLVVDANNRPATRYNRVVNCGSAHQASPVLSMPPVLPLCSPSNYRKFEHVGCKGNFN
ncbi:hypothetical protein QVD17_22389 [Tagetes erecta]|uniref:Uncharacterized protein n=1 Tax=Tagetes erecta TaxID=13708 RepID=A0AAD8KCW7_TARER|nr:hypothetical protein QVD17_22389 [Tagetes erecta]